MVRRTPLVEQMRLRRPTGGEAIFGWYQNEIGEYRWRLTALNHKIIDASTEGYADLNKCLDNAYDILFCKWVPINENSTP